MSADDATRRAQENGQPVRGAILELFAATTSSFSPPEIAEMLKLPLSQITYHIRFLEAGGELRLVGERERSGRTEFLYTFR